MNTSLHVIKNRDDDDDKKGGDGGRTGEDN
jgi:hypothetical protein